MGNYLNRRQVVQVEAVELPMRQPNPQPMANPGYVEVNPIAPMGDDGGQAAQPNEPRQLASPRHLRLNIWSFIMSFIALLAVLAIVVQVVRLSEQVESMRSQLDEAVATSQQLNTTMEMISEQVRNSSDSAENCKQYMSDQTLVNQNVHKVLQAMGGPSVTRDMHEPIAGEEARFHHMENLDNKWIFTSGLSGLYATFANMTGPVQNLWAQTASAIYVFHSELFAVVRDGNEQWILKVFAYVNDAWTVMRETIVGSSAHDLEVYESEGNNTRIVVPFQSIEGDAKLARASILDADTLEPEGELEQDNAWWMHYGLATALQHILTCTRDGVVRVYSKSPPFSLKWKFHAHYPICTAIAVFSVNGVEFIVTGGNDQRVRVFNLNGTEVASYKTAQQVYEVGSIILRDQNEDGSMGHKPYVVVLTGAYPYINEPIYLMDTSLRVVARYYGSYHSDAATFLEDTGKLCGTGGDDSTTLRCWDVINNGS